MRSHARILEHWIGLHLRMKNVLHRTLDRLVHFREWAIFGNVGNVARHFWAFCIHVRVDSGKESSETFWIQVECPLAVRRIGSIGLHRDIREVISCPAFCGLVPPNYWQRAGIWFAMSIAGSAVVEDAHVVWPSPSEVRIKTQTSRVRAR